MKRCANSILSLIVCCGLGLLFSGATIFAAKYDSTIDSYLERIVEDYIKSQRRRGQLASTEQTSFVVYDISREQKLVSINEERSMMAASLAKNFIMLAYFHEVKHRRLSHTQRNRYHLREMIQKSSNPSTNYFIKLIGGPARVNQILKLNYSYFRQTKIVEYIPASGRTYRNLTSARDLNKFYVQLWRNNLPHSDKMKYYFELPNGDYIYKKTYIPRTTKVYNKTGTVYGLIGDSGILVIRDSHGRARPYVFTGLIQDRTKTRTRNRSLPFGTWVNRRANILRRVSERAYTYVKNLHNSQYSMR